MRYLSVCSGIEAATCAWHSLGWQPWAFSDVDKFPSAVLKHHYSNVPNLGDMTKFKEWPNANVDVLVGGTPCQSFSVAGLRAGLADPRGSLMLVYLAIARRYRPRWVVWENVPGVLSSNDGRDFGAFLGGLAVLGYGFAYRVLDAQYFGLAQRRKRVFVVAHLGDWRRAAAVLFERASLSGHPAPRREAGQVAPTIPSRRAAGGGLGTDFDCDGELVAFGGNNTSGPIDVATAVNACGSASGRMGFQVRDVHSERTNERTNVPPLSLCLNAGGMGRIDADSETLIPIGGFFDAPHAFDARQSDVIQYGACAGPLDTDGTSQAIAFNLRGRDGGAMPECSNVASLRAASGGSSRSYVATTAVRRLTPRECERLQGFPDDYTLVPFRGKPAADGPRYKALGNSMAVPVMRWIGSRIWHVECA